MPPFDHQQKVTNESYSGIVDKGKSEMVQDDRTCSDGVVGLTIGPAAGKMSNSKITMSNEGCGPILYIVAIWLRRCVTFQPAPLLSTFPPQKRWRTKKQLMLIACNQ
jgi:hypothetical protein